jgi:CBS domain-containing protein
MKVKDVMHQGAEWVSPETALSDIAQRMRDLDIGAIPVGENDRLIGMVTDRDITCRGVANGQATDKLTARDVMSKGIFYCNDSEELEDALRIMEQKQVRRLPVINDKKRMVGMLSIGDIGDAAPHELTGEVVASVSAHHRLAVRPVIPEAEPLARLSGTSSSGPTPRFPRVPDRSDARLQLASLRPGRTAGQQGAVRPMLAP